MALHGALTRRGFSVSIATFYYKFLRSAYPEMRWVRELIDYRFLNRVSFTKKLFLKLNFLINKKYHSNDVFIACPGGYINSYYGIKRCLLPLVEGKKQGSKTAIYAQSVGPLNDRDSRLLESFSSKIDVIVVRDSFSRSVIDALPIKSKVMQSKDAAFLLTPRQSNASDQVNKVAVSVRRWEFDQRDMMQYYELIKALCRLVLKAGFDIEFISTCQGVKKYRDDSKEASRIAQQLLDESRDWSARIAVNNQYHPYQVFMDKLNTEYAFTIGTRLHMCILSMLNGIPAFNISYEVKGKECYQYLHLENATIDFNEPMETALAKFEFFLSQRDAIKNHMWEQVQIVHKESHQALDEFLLAMNM